MMIPQMTAQEARQKLDAAEPRFVLLDCRENDELQICRISGATHIPMNDIPTRLTELDPDAEIAVICHSGRRSQRVAVFLTQQGFSNVKNLVGGIDAWSVEVDPSLPRY